MEDKKKYSAKFFRDNIPEWKKKKDPPLSRVFYRRVAFVLAAIAANHGVTANKVSYFSMYVAILSAGLFLFNKPCAIIGAFLVNVWLVLDCTDGNIARNVASQPFGEFADGISSYVIVGLLCTTMGYYVFNNGGLLIAAETPIIILIGAFASTSDTLMRLIYQKFKNTERSLADKGVLQIKQDDRQDHSKVNSLRVRIESDLGIGGILPLMILVCVLCNALDIVVLYCFIYYVGSCILASAITIRKAKNVEKETRQTTS